MPPARLSLVTIPQRERRKGCLQRSLSSVGDLCYTLYFDEEGFTHVNVTPLVGRFVPLCNAVCTADGQVMVHAPDFGVVEFRFFLETHCQHGHKGHEKCEEYMSLFHTRILYRFTIMCDCKDTIFI